MMFCINEKFSPSVSINTRTHIQKYYPDLDAAGKLPPHLNSLSGKGQKYVAEVEKMVTKIKADTVDYSNVYGFAGRVLNLDGEDRVYLLNTLWTDELIHTLCDYIHGRKLFWNDIFIAMGNAIAYPYQPLIDRLVNCQSFLQIITDLLSIKGADPIILSAQLTAALMVCRCIHMDSFDIPSQLLAFTPLLLKVANIAKENANNAEGGVEVQCFRCLCAIFARPKYRQEYEKEFKDFKLLSEKGTMIPVLLKEFGYGLEGRRVLRTSFSPNAENYALTLQALSTIPELETTLLSCGILPLLRYALSNRLDRCELSTCLVWSRCVNVLLNLSKYKDFQLQTLPDEMINLLNNVASRPYSSLFPSQPQSIGRSLVDQSSLDFMRMRKRAADIVLSFRWDVQRLFWLAGRKTQPQNCYLQRLPDELIRRILKWLVLLGGVNDKSTDIVRVLPFPYAFFYITRSEQELEQPESPPFFG